MLGQESAALHSIPAAAVVLQEGWLVVSVLHSIPAAVALQEGRLVVSVLLDSSPAGLQMPDSILQAAAVPEYFLLQEVRCPEEFPFLLRKVVLVLSALVCGYSIPDLNLNRKAAGGAGRHTDYRQLPRHHLVLGSWGSSCAHFLMLEVGTFH